VAEVVAEEIVEAEEAVAVHAVALAQVPKLSLNPMIASLASLS
jgi:hypothetical protein